MSIHSAGLIDYWTEKYQTKDPCIAKKLVGQEPVTLYDLTYVYLLIGCTGLSISTLALCVEYIIYCHRKYISEQKATTEADANIVLPWHKPLFNSLWNNYNQRQTHMSISSVKINIHESLPPEQLMLELKRRNKELHVFE